MAGPGRITSHRIDVKGTEVFFRASIEKAPPDRPAVVLVHGLVVASSYMVPTAELLASDFRVFAPDLPGFGESGKPPRVLDISGLADALADWMTATGLSRAALLGNSFGCQIAVECAVRHPQRVSHLILQGPTTDPEARTILGQLRLWLRNARFEPPTSRTMLHDYWQAGLPRAWSTMRHLMADAIERKLPQVRAPTLVVRGEHDPMVPQRWAEQVTRLLRNGRLVVIPGAAHTLVRFAPGACAEAVRHFLLSDRAGEAGRAA